MKAKLTNSVIKALPTSDKVIEIYDTEIKGFLLRIQPSQVKTFYFTYRNQAGTRKRIKIGNLGATQTVAQARDKAIVFAGKVAQGIDVQANKVNQKKEVKEEAENTLRSLLINTYKPWVLVNRKAGQATIDIVLHSFPNLLDIPLPSISTRLLEEWRTRTLESGIARSTVNRKTSALRGVLSKAVEWGQLKEHPLTRFKKIKLDPNTKVRYLNPEEDSRLHSALNAREHEKRDKRSRYNLHSKARHRNTYPEISPEEFSDHLYPMVILALKAGLRLGELFDIEWRDINLPLRLITVKGEIAKSGKTRHIPLSDTALAVITKWKNQSYDNEYNRVFPAENGGRLTDIKKSWKNLMVRAGIENFRFHDLRHDFASQLVMKGVPLNTVRELLGHEDLETTLIYAHLAPDHKHDAVNLLG
jgi:integrase